MGSQSSTHKGTYVPGSSLEAWPGWLTLEDVWHPFSGDTASMTTLSLALAHRILDGGQLLPPAAGWALHCLVIHEVIGVQYCILHLHQKHPRKQWPEGDPGKPTSWASFSRNFLPTMAILWLACCPWDSQGLKKRPVDLSYPPFVVGSG